MLDKNIGQLTNFESDEARTNVNEWLLRHNNRFVGIEKLNTLLFNHVVTNYNASTSTKRKNSEKFFNYIHQQHIIPICPICKITPIKFITYHKGYAQYCGAKCAGVGGIEKRMETMVKKYGEEPFKNKDIVQRRNSTNFRKYGHVHFCQSTAGKIKSKETNLRKYGVDHYSKTTEFKEKFTSTMKEKYGVEYAMQSEELKNRYENSLVSTHGVRHPSQSPEIYKNRNNAMKEKYGVEHAMQSKELSEKYKNTMRQRYDVDHPFQSKEIYDKVKSTMVERYGKEYSAQVDYIFDKVKQTNLDRYGVEFPIQDDNIFNKVKRTNLDRYGVEFASQNEKIKLAKRFRMEAEGKWIPLSLLTETTLYYRQVIRYTNTQPLHELTHFDKRGLAGVAGAYHVDHKVSIKYGFVNNIPPYIIGNIHNLEMLPWRDNVYKSCNCSMDIEDLIKCVLSN